MGHDGVFRAVALGFPQCENRSELPATAQKLNFFGAPMLSPEDQARLELAELDASDNRIVFLSNVWLDRPGTFDLLHTLMSGEGPNSRLCMASLLAELTNDICLHISPCPSACSGMCMSDDFLLGFLLRVHCCRCFAAGFQDADMIPAMIVMMGNFSARATSIVPDADYVGLREGFRQLARLLDTYPRIKVDDVPRPAMRRDLRSLAAD